MAWIVGYIIYDGMSSLFSLWIPLLASEMSVNPLVFLVQTLAIITCDECLCYSLVIMSTLSRLAP